MKKNKLQTYLIKQSDIKKIFKIKDAIIAVEEAFKLYGEGKVQLPPKIYLTFKKGDLRSMPAYIPKLGMAGIKNVNVHPKNKKIPTVMATITLIDPETGFPVAIMDGTYITKLRTGAAGAVAAKYLSRKNSKTAAFIGAGEQAQAQLEGLMIIKPSINIIYVYDLNQNKAKKFCQKYSKKYNLKAFPVNLIQKAIENADIIEACTSSSTPIIKSKFIREGTHINAIGADAPGKQELESAILKKSKIIIDNWEQASHSGEINVPLSEGIITKNNIYAEIGEIIADKKKGRENPEEITIFDSTGLAIQDLACAIIIYKKLTNNQKLEKELQRINF